MLQYESYEKSIEFSEGFSMNFWRLQNIPHGLIQKLQKIFSIAASARAP